MNEGDIVLTTLITSDGNKKKRPALILKIFPGFNDLLLCGISTQTHQIIPEFDLLITEKSNDFLASGLIKESIIRLSYISTVPQRSIEGKIGYIGTESHKMLIKRLCDYLNENNDANSFHLIS